MDYFVPSTYVWGPLFSIFVMRLPVSLVQVSDLWHKWVIWVGISHQWADRQKHLWDGESWWPLALKNVETNASIWGDVAMVNSRCRRQLGWLEWIVRGESDVQEEHFSCVRGVIWSHDSCLPGILIFRVKWTRRTITRWVLSEID